MVKRWDEQSGAFVETSNAPMRYDPASGAWVETTGMAWDTESQAWTERWGHRVSAYVYGAASETVTIKKNGIIVATVSTNSSGCSNEQISLGYGTYTLTGSVSGYTEEQTVDENTTRFRSMPEGALYWYGNEITELDLTNYKRNIGYTKQSNSKRKTNSIYDIGVTSTAHESAFGTNEMIDVSNYSNVYIAYKYNNSSIEKNSMDVSNLSSVYVCVTHCLTTNPREQFIIYALTKKTVTSNDEILLGMALYDASSSSCNPTETYALWLEK